MKITFYILTNKIFSSFAVFTLFIGSMTLGSHSAFAGLGLKLVSQHTFPYRFTSNFTTLNGGNFAVGTMSSKNNGNGEILFFDGSGSTIGPEVLVNEQPQELLSLRNGGLFAYLEGGTFIFLDQSRKIVSTQKGWGSAVPSQLKNGNIFIYGNEAYPPYPPYMGLYHEDGSMVKIVQPEDSIGTGGQLSNGLIYASIGKELQFLDQNTFEVLHRMTLPAEATMQGLEIKKSSGETLLVLGDQLGNVQFIDTTHFKVKSTVPPSHLNTTPVTELETNITDLGDEILAGFGNALEFISKDGKLLHEISVGNEVFPVFLLSNGNFVVYSDDEKAYFVNHAGEILNVVPAVYTQIYSLDSPQGKIVALMSNATVPGQLQFLTEDGEKISQFPINGPGTENFNISTQFKNGNLGLQGDYGDFYILQLQVAP